MRKVSFVLFENILYTEEGRGVCVTGFLNTSRPGILKSKNLVNESLNK